MPGGGGAGWGRAAERNGEGIEQDEAGIKGGRELRGWRCKGMEENMEDIGGNVMDWGSGRGRRGTVQVVIEVCCLCVG